MDSCIGHCGLTEIMMEMAWLSIIFLSKVLNKTCFLSHDMNYLPFICDDEYTDTGFSVNNFTKYLLNIHFAPFSPDSSLRCGEKLVLIHTCQILMIPMTKAFENIVEK